VKVVVTGGSGQLGTLVLRRLCAERQIKEVVSLDLRPPLAACAKLRAATCDVRDPGVRAHLEGADALFHLAFVVTTKMPRETFDAINVGGSENVFTAALAAGVRTIVYASSIAAYGVLPGHPVPIVESTPRRRQPDFPYSCAKYDVEALLDVLEARHPDVAIARLRPAVLVGGRMEHALGRLMRHRLFPDAGGVPMPMLWDEDAADAFVKAYKLRARGAFNLCADDLRPCRELAGKVGLRPLSVPRALGRGLARARALLERLGAGPPKDPARARAAEATLIPSSERARAELGWRPRAATAEAVLRKTLEVMPDRLDPRLWLFFRGLGAAARRIEPPEGARAISTLIHLQLTGPGGGDLTLRLDDGRLDLTLGAPRPPRAVVTLRATTMLELLAGRLDLGTAQMTGKVRFEGEPVASMVLGGMVSTWRSAGEARGLPGRAARLFQRALSPRPPALEGAAR
jgi:nucleoside-diphosphate-sugar epimerase